MALWYPPVAVPATVDTSKILGDVISILLNQVELQKAANMILTEALGTSTNPDPLNVS